MEKTKTHKLGWCEQTNGWCCYPSNYSSDSHPFYQGRGQTLDEFKTECLQLGFQIVPTRLMGDPFPWVWGDYVLVRQRNAGVVRYLHVSSGRMHSIGHNPNYPPQSRYDFYSGIPGGEHLFVATEEEAREHLELFMDKMKLRNLLS